MKFLAEHALKLKPKYHYKDVEPSPAWRPYEFGYAPTALAVSSPAKGWAIEADDGEGKGKKVTKYAWPGVIRKFIDHWATRADARDYANDDIVYTRELDKHFGYPEPGDNDSTLTCMVAAVRWHGFTINREGIKALMAKAQAVVAASPVNINKPSEVRPYVMAAMDDTEGVILETSTKKANLEAISKWGIGEMCPTCKGKGYLDKETDICPQCNGVCYVGEPEPCGKCQGDDPQCARCGGTGVLKVGRHPAGVRALEILKVKFAAKEIELYDKLLLAGKFHASFVVIGALSSRMAGADGLNAQGIKHTKEVRQTFPLTWEGVFALRRRLQFLRGDNRRRRVQRRGPVRRVDRRPEDSRLVRHGDLPRHDLRRGQVERRQHHQRYVYEGQAGLLRHDALRRRP